MIKYYGVFDAETGSPTAFYNDDIYPEGVGIPLEAVEITKEQWLSLINSSGAKVWNGTDVVDAGPIQITTDMLLEYARGLKRSIETSGITIDGFSVATDRQSQAMIAQTVVSLQINPNLVLNWRNPDGSFIVLTSDSIKSIAYFVSLHVSNTFTALSTLTPLIDNGTITSKDQIDDFLKENINTAFSRKGV